MPAPDTWLVLTARIPADDPLRDLTAEGLLALGGLSVSDEGDSLTTYLEADADPERQVREAERFLADWIADDCPELVWRLQPNEDWEREWKRGLAPRKVSERIVVKPSWTGWSPAPGEIVIDIDPQMAFGTGEHATTRGCLALLDRHLPPRARVLDVGSGSGILSIAAARLGAAEVIAVEYDQDANINARENLSANGVQDRVRLVEAMADPPLLASLGTFDIVLANILSGVIQPLMPAFATSLTPQGRVIASGILRTEREAVVGTARSAGLFVADEIFEEEWWSACFGR